MPEDWIQRRVLNTSSELNEMGFHVVMLIFLYIFKLDFKRKEAIRFHRYCFLLHFPQKLFEVVLIWPVTVLIENRLSSFKKND